ncbi:MAG: nucleoside hydrolase [Bacteroidales bacterium]|jgi:pyrimidine-specific ribonucleoside hydrolase|nr:nucleoside hydrolase [Bacteroidales bacterium]
MKSFILILTGLLFALNLSSHPWKPNHYVIIDTDGGIDDMKAITMLLASPDVRVLAITVSPGALSAENAYIKVRSLLNSFYHEGIPVGINREDKFSSKNFPVALQFKWGDESGIKSDSAPGHLQLIGEILSAEKTKIRFVCLAGMSTAGSALRNIPEFSRQVRDIVWSASATNITEGFNYNIDKNASAKMLKQEIPLKIVGEFAGQKTVLYDNELLNLIRDIGNIYSSRLSDFFASDAGGNHMFSFMGTDEMTAVFIHYPELFMNRTAQTVSDCIPSDTGGIKKSIIRILKRETVVQNQVIKVLPADPSFYFDDINNSVNEIISRYGIDEWTSGVLANELHRHLGVFAIIGVKMGIRAREYFNTGVDEFSVISNAGSIPPLSCMNDGLQVSTGATPGHGLLTVINDVTLLPSAEFTYLNKRIRLTLKPDLAEKISGELKEINYVYGLDSNIYWELVRKNSIKYWKELDRHEIFIIEEI